VEAGEAHEAAALDERLTERVRADESRRAVLSYKAAALDSVREGGAISPDYPPHAFNCLGLALKRKGEFSMAQRAYRWGLLWCTGRDAEAEHNRGTLTTNLARMWTAMQQSADRRRQTDMEGMLRQKEMIAKKNDKGTSNPLCHVCGVTRAEGGGPLLQCSGCRRAYYCSPACQKEDWKRHKSDCKRWSKE